jgi:DNA-binding CsgD family transcriptional regulator
VSAATIVRSPQEPSATDLLGRADELAEGERFFRALRSEDRSRALILTGAAGIGKTALWRALLDHARAHEIRTLIASPAASEADLSFAALTDLLSGIDGELIDRLPEPQRRALRVAMLEEPAGDAPSDLRTVAAGLLGVIRTLAGSGPVVLAIDDAQWLDPASRASIEFVARRLDKEAVGLLLAARDDGDGPARLDLGSALRSASTSLAIAPLSAAALYQLLRLRLGHSFARPTLVRIAEWSDGNPLLALEIGRAILATGGAIDAAAPPPIPPDVGRALAARIETLDRAQRRTLLVAACASRPTEAQVRAACRRLRWPFTMPADQTLLARTATSLRFGHPLVAAQSIATATDADRRTVERALASLVEDPEEHARHLALAAVGPDENAALAAEAGARSADRRGASEAAIDLAELATRLTPRADLPSVARRRRALGEILLRTGETARAVEVLRRVVREAAPGPERAVARVLLADALLQAGATIEARRLCDAALEDAGPDRLARARVELTLERTAADAHEAREHAEAALELLRDGPSDLRARALADTASWISRLGGPVPQGLVDEAVALEADAAPDRLVSGARATRAWLWLMSDELDLAHAEYEQLRDRAEALGDESSLARILVELAQIDLRAGNWRELEGHAQAAVRVAERAGRAHDRAMAIIQLGAVAAARGEREAAEQHLDEAQAFGVVAGDPMILAIVAGNRGLLALTTGDPAEADALFVEGEQHLAEAHLGDEALMRYQADRIEALVALGHIEEAASLADGIEARAMANNRRRPMAFVARGRGFVAAARGDLDEALDAFTASHRALVELGMRFEAARSLLARGIVHRRRRQKRRAHEDLSQALETFRDLAATAWVDRTREELGRIGLRPSAPRALTDTERTVALLAARGRTNREIAVAAFMSPRTVEGVLARVYAKLAISSRAELGRSFAHPDVEARLEGEARAPSAD